MAWQKVLSKLRTLFNIGKKLFDILDDIWSTLRLYLPQPLVKFITPFVTGGVGFVIYLGETVQGVRAIHRAYKNEKKKGQKKTRLISAIASTVIAASGVGIALSMMAYLLGAAVSTVLVTWSPILVPGLLAGMYSLVLLRRAYVFHKAKQEEARDRQALEQFERSEKRDWRLGKGFHYKPIDFEKNRDGFRTEGQYVARQAVLKEKYLASQRRRLNAERKLAFNVIEVFASSLIVTAAVLGTVAIMGASVATMGGLPLSLVITGVLTGTCLKLSEYFDRKYDHRFSLKLRRCFSSEVTPLEIKKPQVRKPRLKPQMNSAIHRQMLEENMIEMTVFKAATERSQAFETSQRETKGDVVIIHEPRPLAALAPLESKTGSINSRQY